jgi:hypothetical protein
VTGPFLYTGVGEPATLPGDQCTVHGSHRPAVRESVQHHMWPLGMGGPDVAGNLVRVCPTGHANVHRAIRALIRGVPAEGTRSELVLARHAVEAWTAAGKPGRPE